MSYKKLVGQSNIPQEEISDISDIIMDLDEGRTFFSFQIKQKEPIHSLQYLGNPISREAYQT